jgi:class 3 adenylate cyclase
MAILHDSNVLGSPEITEAVTAAVHLVAGRELLDKVDELGVATAGLPEGVVTFLLTDIEGSTLLLDSLGETYAAVLTQVRTHIREAVLEAGGRQVEARADEFVAVFEGPTQAVRASVEMQRSMAKHKWPGDHDVRIRVGLHTGEILLTETGYVGLTVHTAARIMSAAHGGQVLLSDNTAGLCESIGDKIAFTSLGSHQLRGIKGKRTLLQVEADGLLTDFPRPVL